MTNQHTAFDSGIKCMPSEENTVGLEHNLLRSSAEILTELFCSLNAKPPDTDSLESSNSLVKKSNKHHKKNKKHKHSSLKHKRKPKSKKSKRHKKMNSVVPVGLPETCMPSTSLGLPNDISDKNHSRPTSVISEDVGIDKKSKSMPSCAEDGYVIIETLDQKMSFLNNHAEIENISEEINLELDKSVTGKFQDGLDIIASCARPTTSIQVIDSNLDMETTQTRPNKLLIVTGTKENLNDMTVLQNEKGSGDPIVNDSVEKRQLSSVQSLDESDVCPGLQPAVALPPVISYGGDKQIDTENTLQPRIEVVNKMSASESQERSLSPTKKPKKSKECSPEKGGHKQSSRRLRDRNRSKSQDLDHLKKKNGKGSKAKDSSLSNRKNRSRSRDFDHESNDRRKRSKSLGKKGRDDRKKKRSSSKDRKGHVVSRSCDERKEKGRRSREKPQKRKRSISQDRSSDRKNAKKRQRTSVILRKGKDRSRSRDRKQSISPGRSTNRKRKSRSRNRSVALESKIQSVSRERSTSVSKIESQSKSLGLDNESLTKISPELIEGSTEAESRVKESLSRSKDVEKPITDKRSTSMSVDLVEPQGENHNAESLKNDSLVSLSKDTDSCESKIKDKSKSCDVDISKADKKRSHRSSRKSPSTDSRHGDRKRRSRSADSSSPQKRLKRKSRSRSRSHNKDSKKSDKRRQSKSKDGGENSRKERKSRSKSKSRHSHKTKKSKSKDREDRSKNKPRSKSKDKEGRKKSRSRSRDKDKSSHRTEKRSRSRSLERSHRGARKRRSRSREVHIDKRKLFEIARKNAMTMLKQAAAPFGAENLVTIKAGGKSVEELTDFCKQLSKKETGASSDSGDEDPDMHHSDSDVERPFHHPFQLKERPTNIVLNIRNSVSVPTKTFQEKTAEQSKQLRLQFPVSSGQNHRKTESEWVPVAPGQTAASAPTSASASQPSQSTSAAVASPVLNAAQTDSPSSSSVFPQAPASPPDIGNIVEKRVNAMRKLTANPNDSHAISQIYQVNQQMSMWLASKQQPGQFTGSTGAKVLTAAQLSTGYQAWAKKVTPPPDPPSETLDT